MTRLESRCRKGQKNKTLIKEQWIYSLVEVVIKGHEGEILVKVL